MHTENVRDKVKLKEQGDKEKQKKLKEEQACIGEKEIIRGAVKIKGKIRTWDRRTKVTKEQKKEGKRLTE